MNLQYMVFDDDDQNPYELIWFLTVLILIGARSHNKDHLVIPFTASYVQSSLYPYIQQLYMSDEIYLVIRD